MTDGEYGEEVEEQPLLIDEPLAERRGIRRLRTKFDWVLFSLAAFIGLTPLIASINYSLQAIFYSLEGEVAFWALPFGVLVFFLTLTPLILATHAIIEAKRSTLWLALGLTVAAWPLVALAGFTLSHSV